MAATAPTQYANLDTDADGDKQANGHAGPYRYAGTHKYAHADRYRHPSAHGDVCATPYGDASRERNANRRAADSSQAHLEAGGGGE